MAREKNERNRNRILQALRDQAEAVSSRQIAEILHTSQQDMSERSIRLYLAELADEGYVERQGRKGVRITPAGVSYLSAGQVVRRVGLLAARIDQMAYRMDFDLERNRGHVVVNTTVVAPSVLLEHVEAVERVYACGYAVGDRVAILPPGSVVGDTVVPYGMIGFCTVCSVTLNGVLLRHGVPIHSRFGGLLAMRGGEPQEFVELIEYGGTSIDPLEIFIRSGMTDYLGATATGTGRIGASFREFPAESRGRVLAVSEALKRVGLGAMGAVGYPGRSLMGVPVCEGRIGAVVIGGLNPMAVMEERGVRVESRALSGLYPFERMIPYTEVKKRLACMTP